MGSDPGFTARSDSRNGVASIALSGELDMATVPYLDGHLAPFESNGVSAIMLDLRELTFIDSTGLHALVQARERAKTNGQRLILLGTRPSARRLFEVTCTEFLLDDPEVLNVIKQFTGTRTSMTGETQEARLDADV